MFRPGETWVHDCTQDIALKILGVKYRGEEYFKVKALLINRHNGIWYETKQYKIYSKDFVRWSLYD